MITHYRSLMTALILPAFLSGCFWSSSEKNNTQTQGLATPQWSLNLRSDCPGQEESLCLGKYAFSMNSLGKFKAGPGPQGQIREGQLPLADLQELSALLQPSIEKILTKKLFEEVQFTLNNYEKNDSIELEREGSVQSLYKNEASNLSVFGLGFDEADLIRQKINSFAEVHYLLPFGSSCGDAMDQVLQLQQGLQSCAQDAECIYVDPQKAHELIPPNSLQWVLIESCTVHPTLATANLSQLIQGVAKLNAAVEATQTACGAQYYRINCTYQEASTAKAPACIQGRCQAQY